MLGLVGVSLVFSFVFSSVGVVFVCLRVVCSFRLLCWDVPRWGVFPVNVCGWGFVEWFL